MDGLGILDGLIYGRVEPHIYAFETKTVPNFLKVGDTYRPVKVRLDEWRKHYSDLVQRFDEVAKVDEDTYFRDYSVHHYLEHEKKLERIKDEDFTEDLYKSNEFFRDATEKDIEDAIADIQKNFDENSGKYVYYNIDDHLSKDISYIRDADWKPRANQQVVIDNYLNAVKNGRTNLLMYAVMRFGKSFTALCCAKESNAKLVVVVCGKTDVKEEWRKNVLKPKILEGYGFVDTNELVKNPNIISSELNDNKKVVVFLTLQDLLGDNIKDKHLDLFNLNQEGKIDLLIIDETHFAARSEQTGKVLKNFLKKDFRQEEKGQDESIEDLQECVKQFNPKVKLHLSGTPYRILMNGEFTKDDIIAFVQYDDIVREQEKWDSENMEDEEWKNPYYGFPQMIRFAFNLNQSSIDRLNQMKNTGVDFHLNTLFRPASLNKDEDNNYKKFKYEKEVLDLLQAIDGTKNDDNIFAFLNYDKIKDGKMCRHIVMVLPNSASCDAMKELLAKHKFNNLNDYNVINLAGLDSPKKYSNTNPNNVINLINDIKKYEEKDQKTITLTVGKMLTGSTVEYWDTMIFLKDTSSPQEYDQAIFRLQSQYVKTINGDGGKEIKYNMKPQTLLVDFDPTRMFVMQNRKSLISNINTSIRGNDELEERLKEELRISPIILFNKDKIKKIEPTDIIDEVCKYSANKSILDETFDVTVDNTVFDDESFLSLIRKQPEMSANGTVFVAKPNKGGGDDAEAEESNADTGNTDIKNKVVDKKEEDDKEQKSLIKRLQTYYFKILLFAYLSDLEEKTISDIINNIENDDNAKRIANNIQLDIEGLKYIREKIHPVALNELENKISNMDRLSGDNAADVQTAMRRFSRLSESEIITPEWVAKEMIDILPEDVTSESKFLNIAGKTGEFEYAIIKRYGDDIKNNIYTIPTSGVTYECTHKMFQLLGIPTKNIYTDFNSFDLIDKNKNQDIIKTLSDMKFDAVVGNPPYQEEGLNTRKAPIYHLFYDLAFNLSDKVSLISPARFLYRVGQTPKGWMDRILNDKHFKVVDYFQKSIDVFPTVVIKGGVAITYRDTKQDFGKIEFFSNFPELKTILQKVYIHNDFKKEEFSRIVSSQGIYRFSNLALKEHPEILAIQGQGTAAKITSRGFEKLSDIFLATEPENTDDYVKIIGLSNGRRVLKWIKVSYIQNVDSLNFYKVFVPEANGTGAIGEVLSTPMIGSPMIGHTDTFLTVGMFNDYGDANNCLKYVSSKFARTLLGTLKATQHNPRDTWANVPLQDFTFKSDIDWTQPISDIDKQLYRKYNLSEEEINFIESMIKPME